MAAQESPRFDLVIEGALVYDGSGRVPVHADVGVRRDRVRAIGSLEGATARRRIDARGLSLCPGFVDVHSHADFTVVRKDHASVLEPLVRQGITTFVGGNCGSGMAPVLPDHEDDIHTFFDFFLGSSQRGRIGWSSWAEMADVIAEQGSLLNVGLLAPHGILRLNVMGDRNEVAGPDDLRVLKRELSACLEAGALGMSTGLMYFPGLASDSHELTELARVVHDFHGVFTSHLRSYNSDTMVQALDEVMDVCRDAEVPLQVSHLFCIPNLPEPVARLSRAVLRGLSRLYDVLPLPIPVDGLLASRMERAFARADAGEPIGFDAMPTSAGFTHLLAFFPPWTLQGGIRSMLDRLRDPDQRREIRRSIEQGDVAWPHRGRDSWSMNIFKVMGWDAAFIMSVTLPHNRCLEGKSLQQIGDETGRHPFDVACDLLVEEQGRVLVFETATQPGDPFVERSVLAALSNRHVSVVTDTILLGFGLPSHLFYDAYPRWLGTYARDRGVVSMSEAIRRSTSLPASQLGLRDRGRIGVGSYADLVLFHERRILSRSTARDPAHFPEGIHTVWINGRAVVDPEGFHPDPLPGRLVRRGE